LNKSAKVRSSQEGSKGLQKGGLQLVKKKFITRNRGRKSRKGKGRTGRGIRSVFFSFSRMRRRGKVGKKRGKGKQRRV